MCIGITHFKKNWQFQEKMAAIFRKFKDIFCAHGRLDMYVESMELGGTLKNSDLTYVVDAVCGYKRKTSTKKLIFRVFGGAHSNIQTIQLNSAINRLGIDQSLFQIETMVTDYVNVNKLTIKEIVDWLLEGDIHWICGHIHQGLVLNIINSHNYGGFTMSTMVDQLQRLKCHPGFPRGPYLKCPIFLQDKFEYLKVLQEFNMCNPTMRVFRPLEDNGLSESTTNSIKDFLGNCKSEGCGWVVKPPFVTNRVHFKVLEDESNVVLHIQAFFRKDTNKIFPYTMIQPCMANRKEYKVVYIQSKGIQYITSSGSTYKRKAYSTPPHTELFTFVKQVVLTLQNACPSCIVDGLFRVDVFQNQEKQLVVNELESLEAGFTGGSTGATSSNEVIVTDYLQDYWLSKLTPIPIVHALQSLSKEKRNKL